MFILLCGCGGLGTEVLKLLHRTHTLTVIDRDVVEISNLSRQFLFSREDVHKHKAVSLKNPKVHGIVGDVMDLSASFLEPYDVVITTLDNVVGRMHINFLVRTVKKSIILLDIGVEGNRGHIKLVTPYTSCLFCIKELYTTEQELHLCTLKNTQNLQEKDNFFKLKFLASEIAREKFSCINKHTNCTCYLSTVLQKNNKYFNNTLTLFSLKGIEHKIIPNTCYTNSILSSLAILTLQNYIKNKQTKDYYFYNGDTLYLNKLEIKKDPHCILCNINNQYRI